MTYTAELIAVGTELLLGNIANTDAQMISQELSALGIHVYYHTVVGDNDARLRSAVDIAKSRADILITTGGLGPTYDDMTKQTLAAAFGLPLVLHEPTAERIRSFFRNRDGSPMTENNLQQAMLPEGCTIFDNDWGTAPGCAFQAQGKHVIMLPGPPRECTAMMRQRAIPYLRQFADGVIFSRNIRIFGLGESQVEDRLRARMLTLDNPTLAPYAKEGEVLLRVTAKARTQEEAAALLEPEIAYVKEIIGDAVYGVDVESLEQVVLDLLHAQGKTLAVAESCTGGLLAGRITDTPGASKSFLGGVTAYSDGAKAALLGVPEALLQEHGAVSSQVAAAMAQGARRALGADLALSTTGVAGPDSDSRGNSVGLVYVALAAPERTWVSQLKLTGTRARLRTFSAGRALDLLRRYLTGLELPQ